MLQLRCGYPTPVDTTSTARMRKFDESATNNVAPKTKPCPCHMSARANIQMSARANIHMSAPANIHMSARANIHTCGRLPHTCHEHVSVKQQGPPDSSNSSASSKVASMCAHICVDESIDMCGDICVYMGVMRARPYTCARARVFMFSHVHVCACVCANMSEPICTEICHSHVHVPAMPVYDSSTASGPLKAASVPRPSLYPAEPSTLPATVETAATPLSSTRRNALRAKSAT